MRGTGNALNFKLTDTFKMCDDCTLGKFKKAGVNKMPVQRLKIKGNCFLVDISLLSSVSIGHKTHRL